MLGTYSRHRSGGQGTPNSWWTVKVGTTVGLGAMFDVSQWSKVMEGSDPSICNSALVAGRIADSGMKYLYPKARFLVSSTLEWTASALQAKSSLRNWTWHVRMFVKKSGNKLKRAARNVQQGHRSGKGKGLIVGLEAMLNVWQWSDIISVHRSDQVMEGTDLWQPSICPQFSFG